jgi:hypothetical protein
MAPTDNSILILLYSFVRRCIPVLLTLSIKSKSKLYYDRRSVGQSLLE